MTIRHLQIFNTVCDCGSITAAVDKLNMAQPAISLAIKELENFYQTKLFDRMNRRLYLTESGNLLRNYSNSILEQFDEAAEVLRDQSKSKQCSFGVNVSVSETVLPHIIKRLKKEIPHIDLDVIVGNSHYIELKLNENKIDFCIVDRLADTLNRVVVPIYSAEMIVVCAPDYRKEDEMTLEELASETLFLHEDNSGNRICTDTVFHSHGLRIHPHVVSISDLSMIRLVQSGLGMTILQREIIEEYIRRGELKEVHIPDVSFKRHYFIAYHEKKYLTHTVRNAIAILTDLDRMAGKAKTGRAETV